jgi:hypothetical protein
MTGCTGREGKLALNQDPELAYLTPGQRVALLRQSRRWTGPSGPAAQLVNAVYVGRVGRAGFAFRVRSRTTILLRKGGELRDGAGRPVELRRLGMHDKSAEVRFFARRIQYQRADGTWGTPDRAAAPSPEGQSPC